MTEDIKPILKKLNIKDTGYYEKHKYIISLDDSDDYAKFYTILDDNAINLENPDLVTNTSNTLISVLNKFELDIENIKYTITLTANFDTDEYKLIIGEN